MGGTQCHSLQNSENQQWPTSLWTSPYSIILRKFRMACFMRSLLEGHVVHEHEMKNVPGYFHNPTHFPQRGPNASEWGEGENIYSFTHNVQMKKVRFDGSARCPIHGGMRRLILRSLGIWSTRRTSYPTSRHDALSWDSRSAGEMEVFIFSLVDEFGLP